MDNSTKPPDSLRAAIHTKTRQEAREDSIRHFIGDDDIGSQVSEIPERRVNRGLNCVFLQMEFVGEGGGRWVPYFVFARSYAGKRGYAEDIVAPGVRIRSELLF